MGVTTATRKRGELGKFRSPDAAGDVRLVAENAELVDRLGRLGPALASMAHDLARIRRENAALKRENLRLRALLEEPRRTGPLGL